MKHVLRGVAAALVLFIAAESVFAESFKVDPSHSSITFSIRHIFSNVTGRFTKMSGTIDYDPGMIDKFRINVTIETGSVNTDNERRDNHLRSGDFFMADSFPSITFTSTKAYKNEQGMFVEGNLTIRGVTKPIVVPFEVLGFSGEPGKAVAGFQAAFKISRKDFNILWNRELDSGGLLLGDEVKIDVNLEAKSDSGK